MVVEIIIFIFLGILAGTITGLIPGIHINLLAAILISTTSFFLLHVSPISVAIFIVAMAITHTFVDFIPATFLGAPDSDTALSILPSHKFLLTGKGYEAIVYTLYGSVVGILIILILTLPFLLFLEKVYPIILFFIPLILILVSLFMIMNKPDKKILALTIFLLSGFLGIASFNQNISQPLLPLLTGLFGSSTLLISMSKIEKIPRQIIPKFKNIKFTKKEFARSTIASAVASPLCSFLPGLGASHAAIIGTQAIKNITEKEFLILLGSINTVVMGVSFITLYTIGKTRTGAAVAISNLIQQISFQNLILILITLLVAGAISFFITIFLAKLFAKNITKINYKILSTTVLIILTLIVIYFTGIIGLIIFFTSTFLGVYTISKGLNRTFLMGCLLLPTILFYLF